ncbi:MAG: cysteine desulfurase [Clostridiales bacterium]|jgi:cysteine desulfurase/selenocysteine lyase|nr:cysteine desulfurase [Clostridiales bacterium]
MDVIDIRNNFPILQEVIYMDSASTSLTPKPVLDAVLGYYSGFRANVGRGVYRTAQLADQCYRDAHSKVAAFIGGEEGTTIFTRNTTESINIVAQGLSWRKGDRIVTTLLEHHSNLLPWMRLREKGVDLQIVKPDLEGRFDLVDFEKAISKNTRLVSISHLSNVLGTVQPIKEISKICREQDVALLVDGAQSVPHMPVKVNDIDCDFLCFSGHKMLGPTGAGVLWASQEDNIKPLLVGGGMVQDVHDECWNYEIKKGFEGFEAGTPDISAGIGLGAAVDFLKQIDIEEIHQYERGLTRRLLEGLQDINGVEIYGPGIEDQNMRGGVVSFGIKNLLPHEVALMLDQASNICVRSGHHCCIPLMKHLKLKFGTVRASVYLYNTMEEVDKLLATLDQIARMA